MNSKQIVAQRIWASLVWLRLPQLYARYVVWWEHHASLRDTLKAVRSFVEQRRIALRNATFGSVVIVATRQVQSREELRSMSAEQIMAAWRGGRLDYLMRQAEGVKGFGDKEFHEWVKNGGQVKPWTQ